MKTNGPPSSLGQFLKSRRERIQPTTAGISTLPGRRRTPGLRREEVAYLANVSLTYYTWLEQGRETNPSKEVLMSIGKALQLSGDELQHVFDLANPEAAGAGNRRSEKGVDGSVLTSWSISSRPMCSARFVWRGPSFPISAAAEPDISFKSPVRPAITPQQGWAYTARPNGPLKEHWKHLPKKLPHSA